MKIDKRITKTIPLAVMLLLFISAMMMYSELKRSLNEEIRNNMHYIASEITGRINSRMKTYEEVLKGISGYYIANNYSVSRKDFLKYASELDIEETFPGIQAVGFSTNLSNDMVGTHVAQAQAQAEGYAGYQLRTNAVKSNYIAVDIMYPDVEENRRVYGFDLTSEPVRAEMLKYSIANRETGLSGKIILKQELTDNAPAGVLMSKPLYKDEKLFGVISAPFRIHQLMDGIFRGDTKNLIVRIYESEIAPSTLLYESGNVNDKKDGYTLSMPLDLYGRTWVLQFDATNSYFKQFDEDKPLLVFFGIFVIGVLLSVLFQILLTQGDKTYFMAQQIAAKLTESENRYHNTFEQASVGIVLISLDMVILSTNKSFRDMLGYDEAEFNGKCLLDYLKESAREGLGEALFSLKADKDRTYKTEKTMIGNKLITVSAEISASVYCDSNGVPQYLILIVEDISRRKQAEDALMALSMQQSAILDNSLACIMKVKNRKIEWVNKAFEELFGMSNSELVGQSTRVLHPTEEEYIRFGVEVDNIEKMLAEGFVQTEVEMVNWDGESLWVDISGKLINKELGSSSIWVLNDVTEKKEAQDKLIDLNINLECKIVEETQRRLEQERLFMQQGRMAAMGEMIGAIAHQWRQPLNIVSLVVQNISEDFGDGQLTKETMDMYMSNVLDQLAHMSGTIDDFRNFFQIEKNIVDFDPSLQTGRVLNLINAQMKAYGISVDVKSDAPCVACGTANEFSQVLLNIINNSKDAFVANKTDKPHIVIKITCEDSFAVIRIRDNGGGIPDAIKTRIFEPYFTTKKKDIGTGIGLYMSKMIIVDHFNGSIQFQNVNDGVEFEIRIPNKRREA